MDKRLDRIVNIAVLVACAAIVFRVGFYAYQSLAPARPLSYARGRTIANTPDLNFNSARRTLILVTSSHCHFCQRSMPFYKRLTSMAHAAGVRVLGLATEDPEVNRDFLLQNGLYVDGVASVKANNVDVHGTPTLIIVDNRGTVIASWEGEIAPRKEKAVEAAVTQKG